MTEIINLGELKDKIDFSRPGVYANGDYILHHFNAGHPLSQADSILPPALKIDGLSIFLCSKGEAALTINFREVTLQAGSVMVLSPNDLVEPKGKSLLNIEGYALLLPIEFLKLMSLDSNTLNYSNISLDASPVIQLDAENLRLINGYFELLELNATTNREPTVYTRNISRSLVGAMIYQLMAFSRDNDREQRREETEKNTSGAGRRRYYVKDFMSMLQQDYRQHRSVGHYADRLFISAKYLSLIIKEATGRTATEWIDHFVILEAKNLLRYSGRNIQQIAYDLNFHNQSAFGKYFKQLTGMSPSEFRKT